MVSDLQILKIAEYDFHMIFVTKFSSKWCKTIDYYCEFYISMGDVYINYIFS